MAYRSKDELGKARERDPIALYERRLREKGQISPEALTEMEAEINAVVDEAIRFADQSPHPDLGELYTDILSEKYPLQK
jgi:TPP-dependent pyruvate/acetoin dehydrogenase alpha subunit